MHERIFWSDELPLLVEATHKVVFWLHHIDQFDGQLIWFSPSITRVVYSHASNTSLICLTSARSKWFTDNQNVVSIVKFGSKKPHLQDGAVSIFDTVLNSP